jgi:transposase
MIGYEVWIMIRQLRDEGYSISAIARELHLDRKTVRKALQQPQPPEYQQPTRPSKLEPHKNHLRQRIQEYPRLSAIRLFEEIRKLGYQGGYTTVKTFVHEIKETHVRMSDSLCTARLIS